MPQTIKLRFTRDDTVWVLSNNKILKTKVATVTVKVSHSGVSPFPTHTDIKYTVYDDANTYTIDRLFATKDDLIKSL